jgi:hypothetical protein
MVAARHLIDLIQMDGFDTNGWVGLLVHRSL